MASQPTLKEWLFSILIPTDVGLLIPTPQCHAFGTVKKTAKTLDFESSVEVQYLENSDQCIKFTSFSSSYSMLDLDIKS